MSFSARSIKSPFRVQNGGSVLRADKIRGQGQVGPTEYPALAPLRTPDQPLSIFRSTYQSGFLSILYAIGQHPLSLWEKQVRNGYVKRVEDGDIGSLCIDVLGGSILTTFITTPSSPSQSLGIRLPILVFVLKNTGRDFMFQVQIMDDRKTRRRFVVSNFSPSPVVGSFSANIPLRLDQGWNQLSLNLAEMTERVYGTEYKETTRVQIHPNCRLRRVYFADRSYSEEEVPEELQLLLMNSAKEEEEEWRPSSSSSSRRTTSTPTPSKQT